MKYLKTNSISSFTMSKICKPRLLSHRVITISFILLFMFSFYPAQTGEPVNTNPSSKSDSGTINHFKVTKPPEELAKKLNLSGFYKKYCDAGGLPVVSSGSATITQILDVPKSTATDFFLSGVFSSVIFAGFRNDISLSLDIHN